MRTAQKQGDVKKEVERHGAAQHLGQVAGRDGDLAQAASWASASSRDKSRGRPGPGPCPVTMPEPGGDDLHDDRHEARQGDDPQQIVAVCRPSLEVGSPVAGVHVADADEEGRARRRPAIAARSRLRRRATAPCHSGLPGNEFPPGRWATASNRSRSLERIEENFIAGSGAGAPAVNACDLGLAEAAALLRRADLSSARIRPDEFLPSPGRLDAFALFGSTLGSRLIRNSSTPSSRRAASRPTACGEFRAAEVIERIAPYLSRQKAPSQGVVRLDP